jgi:hypothetical protein
MIDFDSIHTQYFIIIFLFLEWVSQVFLWASMV